MDNKTNQLELTVYMVDHQGEFSCKKIKVRETSKMYFSTEKYEHGKYKRYIPIDGPCGAAKITKKKENCLIYNTWHRYFMFTTRPEKYDINYFKSSLEKAFNEKVAIHEQNLLNMKTEHQRILNEINA